VKYDYKTLYFANDELCEAPRSELDSARGLPQDTY